MLSTIFFSATMLAPCKISPLTIAFDSHFPKGSKIDNPADPGEGPEYTKNLHPFSILPMTGKLFEKAILKIVQRQRKKRHV
jgi:hypothetical protein